MRVLVQRVRRARVTVAEETTGEIGRGFLLLVGVTLDDTAVAADLLARKVANLRVFDDADGNLNRSALELLEAGEPIGMLVISQFTLYADCRKGRRPASCRQRRPPAPSRWSIGSRTDYARLVYRWRRDASARRCRSSWSTMVR